MDLLNRVEVKPGHFHGRIVALEGYKGTATFTDFAKRAATLYETDVGPMLEKLFQYDKDVACTIFLFKAFLNKAIIPYPIMSVTEEKKSADTIAWYKSFSSRMNEVYTSQDSKVSGTTKIWDQIMNTVSGWKAAQKNSNQDAKSLERLIEYREYNESPTKNIGLIAAGISIAALLQE